MDLWQTIKADQTRILEICNEVLSELEDRAKNRGQLFGQLLREMDRYMGAEENVLYPALESDERTRADTLRVARQHEEISGMLDRLTSHVDKNSPEWRHLFENLFHTLEQHFSLLEHGVLVTARGTLSPQDAEALKEDFERGSLHGFRAARRGLPVVIERRSWPLSTGLLLAGAVTGVAALLFARSSWRGGETSRSSGGAIERRSDHNRTDLKRT